MSLPRSAALTVWLNASLRGAVGPDDFAAAVRGEDPQHLVVDWPDRPVLRLDELPAAAVRAGARAARLALPTPGDLLGLRGPAAFNAAALDAGEAVVLDGAGLGMVPALDARTVLWRVLPAEPAPLLDPAEEGRLLRQELTSATNALVSLDVASWAPEVADLLMDRHRPALSLPGGLGPRAVEDLDRALLCGQIVDLGLADEGGATSSYEIAERRRCLTHLARAARRVVVAVCSDSLSPS